MTKIERLFRIDFYPQDWLVDTSSLTAEENGIYIQIIALIYCKRGPIENDPDEIRRRLKDCSLRKAKSLIQALAEKGFVTISDGKIGQKRAESELKTKRNHLESSAKGGRNKAEREANAKENKEIASSDHPEPLSSPSLSLSLTAKEEGWLDRPEPTSASETDQPSIQPKFISGEEFSKSIPGAWVEWAIAAGGFTPGDLAHQAIKLSQRTGTGGNVTFAQWSGWIESEIKFRNGNEPAQQDDGVQVRAEKPALSEWQQAIARETGEPFCRRATDGAEFAAGVLTVRQTYQKTMLEQRSGDMRRAGVKEIRVQS